MQSLLCLIIWLGESEEQKTDGYCDLAHLLQNVSNSPQDSTGMKHNRRQPAEHLQPHGEESADSCARAYACSNLLIFNSKH